MPNNTFTAGNMRVAVPGCPPKPPIPHGHRHTRRREQEFVDSKIANESYVRMGQKTMVGFYTLKNGYEFVTYYSYANKVNFDSEVAQEQCRKKASLMIWDMYSFHAQESDYTVDNKSIDTGDIPISNLKTPEQIIAEEEARDILNQNIRTAKQLKESDYTAESWANFAAFLSAAEEIVGAYNSTAEEISNINDSLVDAMIALVPVVSDDTSADTLDSMAGAE